MMLFLASTTGGAMRGVLDLILLLLIFAGIIFMAYWTSKMAAKLQANTMAKGNMEIIETMRVQNNKFVQIIKIGEKYVAIGVGKDEITFLTELDETEIVKRTPVADGDVGFKDIIGRLMKSSDDSKGQDKS